MDLTTKAVIETSFFVKIVSELPGQFTQTLLFSDHFEAQTFDDVTYTPLGKLMSISPTSSELRTSSQSVSISISGIPNISLQEILYYKWKGSVVEVRRGIYESGVLVEGTGNPIIKFKGFVDTWSLSEDYDVVNRTSTNIIQFDCASTIDVLNNKRSGRRTDPASMKSFFPNDVSFDRVPALVNTKFNFGGELE